MRVAHRHRRSWIGAACVSLVATAACTNGSSGAPFEGAGANVDSALLAAPAPSPSPVLATGAFVYDRALESSSKLARTGTEQIVVALSTSGSRHLDITTALFDGHTSRSALTVDATGAFAFSSATASSTSPWYGSFRVPANASLGATWPPANELPYGPAFAAAFDRDGVGQIDRPAHTVKEVIAVPGGRVLRVATLYRRHVAMGAYATRMTRLAPEIAPGDHGVVGVGSSYLAIRDATNEVVVLGGAQALQHADELATTARPTFAERASVPGVSLSGARLTLSQSQMNAALASFVSGALGVVPTTRDALVAATRTD